MNERTGHLAFGNFHRVISGGGGGVRKGHAHGFNGCGHGVGGVHAWKEIGRVGEQ